MSRTKKEMNGNLDKRNSDSPMFHPGRKLAKKSGTPLWSQLADIIRNDITSGRLRRGDVIPTEKEIGFFFGVSRITVRGALATLVEDGLLYRRKGKGTMVKQEKITRQAPGLLGLHEEIEATGRVPLTKVSRHEIVDTPPEEVRRSLMLKSDEGVIRIEREVYADDEILGVSMAYIPLGVWRKIGLKPAELGNHSLYQLLEKTGYKLYEAEETIEVINASKKQAGQLGVTRGFSLFSLKRTVYAQDGQPVEWGQNVLRADKYQFRMHHWRER